MAYDSALYVDDIDAIVARATVIERNDQFRRLERIVVLMGMSAVGAACGFAAAMALGRLDLWMVIAAAAPFMLLALHFTAITMRDAVGRRAYGCATAAGLHVAALLAWPITSLLSPIAISNFWIAPVAAMTTLFLVASCWQGGKQGVYRVGLQGLIVAIVAAHQGTLVLLGA